MRRVLPLLVLLGVPLAIVLWYRASQPSAAELEEIRFLEKQFERGRLERPIGERAQEARTYLSVSEPYSWVRNAYAVQRAGAVLLADSVARQLRATLRLDPSPFGRGSALMGEVHNPTRVDLGTLYLRLIDSRGDTTNAQVGPIEAGMKNRVFERTPLHPGPLAEVVVLEADTARSPY